MKRIQIEEDVKKKSIKKPILISVCAVLGVLLVAGGIYGYKLYYAYKHPTTILTTPPNQETPKPIDFNDYTLPPEDTGDETPDPGDYETKEPTETDPTETPSPVVTPEPTNTISFPTASTIVTTTPSPTATGAPKVTTPVTPIPTSPVITMPPSDKTYVYNENLINVLVVGVDTTVERKNMGYQSDVLILLSIDKETNEVFAMSIPRDTKAVIDKIKQDGKYLTITGQKTTLINAAFSQGGGASKQSYQNTLRAVRRLLTINGSELPIDYYIGIDIDGVAPVVNALGGVTMTIDYDFTFYDAEMYKGHTMTLNGEQALHYIRERHHIPDSKGADIDRTGRQRNFLRCLAKQIKSQGAVELASKLYQPFLKYIDTNLSLEQTIALASILMKVDIDSIDMRVLPGAVSSGYYVPNQSKLAAIMVSKFYVAVD